MNSIDKNQESIHSTSLIVNTLPLSTEPKELSIGDSMKQSLAELMQRKMQEEINMKESGAQTTTLFLSSKLFDSNSSLKILPKELIFSILILKESAEEKHLSIIKRGNGKQISELIEKSRKVLMDELLQKSLSRIHGDAPTPTTFPSILSFINELETDVITEEFVKVEEKIEVTNQEESRPSLEKKEEKSNCSIQ